MGYAPEIDQLINQSFKQRFNTAMNKKRMMVNEWVLPCGGDGFVSSKFGPQNVKFFVVVLVVDFLFHLSNPVKPRPPCKQRFDASDYSFWGKKLTNESNDRLSSPVNPGPMNESNDRLSIPVKPRPTNESNGTLLSRPVNPGPMNESKERLSKPVKPRPPCKQIWGCSCHF
jgi:hypothetical protein